MTDATAIDTVARTLWGEARNQGRAGMEAVAAVIRNRVLADLNDDDKPDWWGEGWEGVCRKKWQFSCWNEDDPNLPKLMAVTTADDKFRIAMDVARSAIDGSLADRTNGADHYCTKTVAPVTKWAMGRRPCATVGAHLFYKLRPDPKGPKVVRESIAESRTMQGGAVAGTSAIAAGALDQAKDTLTELVPAFPAYAKWIMLALLLVTVAGIGRVLYARYDDWRKGHR